MLGAIASTNNTQKGVTTMAINEYGEIVWEENTMTQEALGTENCGLRMMTRKERFEYLVKEVSEVKQELRTANTYKLQ